jgi:hypothetical protein
MNKEEIYKLNSDTSIKDIQLKKSIENKIRAIEDNKIINKDD